MGQKKPFLKRYGAFFLLLIAGVVTGLVLPDLGKIALNNTIDSFKEMLSVLPPIFILLGLLDVWVDRATMIKYTGKGSGFKGVLIAFLLGSAAAGPLYAAFPFAAVMIKKGTSLTNLLIFIGAWSTTKIPMLAFEAASMGPVFTLVRLGLSLVGIPLIAWVTDRVIGQAGREEIIALNEAQEAK
ncbi:MAG: permease [Firmicutes bacterium HGW-Firmicutes-9]|nr:MAG: permease [Firmicutes bacterium HGW-Firmicutes-9]